MWTDPNGHVWTTGEIVTAANMNTYIKDNLLFLYSPPAFRAYSTAAAQTPASSVVTPITFNAERYNVGSMHSTAVNPTRGTVAVAGRYAISGGLEYAANATGVRLIIVRLNGTTFLAEDIEMGLGGVNTCDMALFTEWVCAVNDYAELCAYQNSGAGLNIDVAPAVSPEFAMSWRGN